MSAFAPIGVVGAGTMGAGIAEAAARNGVPAILHDPIPEALEQGLARIAKSVARSVEKGRIDATEGDAIVARVTGAGEIGGLAPCPLIIEAAPERLELKHAIFAQLSAVAPDAVLASNTSSIPITAIAPAAARPELVVGMHFFNPPPVMRLLEVIAGIDSAPEALALARAAGEALGKHVIDAADVPGFVVNRCNRPFLLEALKLLQERITDVETIDRICRVEGGFRMGPFELADLVGIDVGFEVAKSFQELSFGEPRWQPSPLAARMVAAGLHGRKTGRGWYRYDDGPHRPQDAAAGEITGPSPGASDLVVIAGDLAIAHDLAALANHAGWRVAGPGESDEVPFLCLDCAADPDEEVLQGAPRAILCAGTSLVAADEGGNAVGFHALPPLLDADGRGLVELTRGRDTAPAVAQAAEAFFASLGLHVAWVGDAPGLVLGRIVCQLVNEAAFALGEGVASADDIDAGMELGVNHPRGPLAWGDHIGLDHVLGVIAGLHAETGEERYRPAPLLRRLVLEGRLGEATGEGFRVHDEAHDADGHVHDEHCGHEH
ncbi:3-hydroxyacyl-CoA dehydrogenase NAD-binding domain-containing protein [Paraconexibacter algicola]|uniref:3-hydroxyacyl-CoA dehydrogenase n=1 Tax=Paraconexibacter algicola TaxID=2133960 RepID=A0A2T4UEV9_9ACTN|nr:3-hydroxyacyl-CoA dehydrogenase NAD-binding domain-containing protein [Paraconexibacter algicola]PTL56324.1 3-hydroxyacyl-CoA dehydrogenase [Paraconexibacter algicola]